jgi:hypothetical protein
VGEEKVVKMAVATLPKRMLLGALMGALLTLPGAILLGQFFFAMFALGSAPLGGEGFRDLPPPPPLKPADYVLLGAPVLLILGGAVLGSLLVGVAVLFQRTAARRGTPKPAQ